MMLPVDRLRTAMERFDTDALPDVFSAREVTIVENFAPFVFEGTDVPARWWRGFRAHAAAGELAELHASFGPATDYERAEESVFFSLPARWNGLAAGRRFVEHGGWAFVLARESQEWRIRAYAWAVTSFALG